MEDGRVVSDLDADRLRSRLKEAMGQKEAPASPTSAESSAPHTDTETETATPGEEEVVHPQTRTSTR
jgi:hypothetical protein